MPEPKPGDRPLREGRIVAYETSPLLDYAAGDATHSYPPTRVRSITRQFVYLRPDAFVIFDRDLATSVEDNYRKWSSDPRYAAWTTQPEYRNFIGPP